jgi:hypothetical protein
MMMLTDYGARLIFDLAFVCVCVASLTI